jgi:DNA-binding transcriptional MerR regulator
VGEVEYTVKQVAQRVELPSRTVRYYDRIGLVSPEGRSEAGYRLYGPEDEGRLRFVRQAKAIGFSLEEIRQLIAAAERGCCGEVVPELERLLGDKVAQVDAQIAELRAFRERLAAYQAGRGSGCGCRGHGAFCGCLNDAPPLKPTKGRDHHGLPVRL